MSRAKNNLTTLEATHRRARPFGRASELAGAALAVLLVSACDGLGGAGKPSVQASSAVQCGGEALIGGRRTLTHQNVGFLELHTEQPKTCTGTLIDDDIVLTAAHCVDYTDRTAPSSVEPIGWFQVDFDNSRSHVFGIQRWKSFGSGLGEKDVALIQLSESVTSRFPSIRSARHANGVPKKGERAMVFGFGCNPVETRENVESGALAGGAQPLGGRRSQPKRTLQFKLNSDFRHDRYTPSVYFGCEGDSGGPMMTADGSVFAVISGGDDVNGVMAFGKPDWKAIGEQIRSWREVRELNACDREGAVRSCGAAVGACTIGEQRCEGGHWTECTGIGPTAEDCDGVDNDCNGEIDEVTQVCDEGGVRLCTDALWSATCVDPDNIACGS